MLRTQPITKGKNFFNTPCPIAIMVTRLTPTKERPKRSTFQRFNLIQINIFPLQWDPDQEEILKFNTNERNRSGQINSAVSFLAVSLAWNFKEQDKTSPEILRSVASFTV